jgi:hypothetical protein
VYLHSKRKTGREGCTYTPNTKLAEKGVPKLRTQLAEKGVPTFQTPLAERNVICTLLEDLVSVVEVGC